jgi:hypothetical protein
MRALYCSLCASCSEHFNCSQVLLTELGHWQQSTGKHRGLVPESVGF